MGDDVPGRAGFQREVDHEPGSRLTADPALFQYNPPMLSIDSLPEWATLERIIYVLIGLALLLIVQRLRRARRRRRPVRLHPKLAKYGGGDETQSRADLDASRRIIATSSTEAVAGYRIVQQIEAVFVDGARSPDYAIAALKAEAGRRGGNAVINLSQRRTAAGRCTAQGDAVVIRPTDDD